MLMAGDSSMIPAPVGSFAIKVIAGEDACGNRDDSIVLGIHVDIIFCIVYKSGRHDFVLVGARLHNLQVAAFSIRCPRCRSQSHLFLRSKQAVWKGSQQPCKTHLLPVETDAECTAAQ